MNLSRNSRISTNDLLSEPGVRENVERLLRTQLNSYANVTEENWIYKLILAAEYRFLGSFWDDIEGGILLRRGSERKMMTFSEARSLPSVVVCTLPFPEKAKITGARPKEWSILFPEYPAGSVVAKRLLSKRYPASVTVQKDGAVRSEWKNGAGDRTGNYYLCAFEGVQLLQARWATGLAALNTRHPLLVGLGRIRHEAALTETELTGLQTRFSVSYAGNYADLRKYLESFRQLHRLPPALAPPIVPDDGELLAAQRPPARKKKPKGSGRR